jgi:ATP-dependent DNA ligase
MEGSEKQSFMDRLKEATGVVATRAREGIEELQTRQELSRTYGELGRKTSELVESGAVSHPELNAVVEKIKSLKAELEAEEAADKEPASPSEPAPPAG